MSLTYVSLIIDMADGTGKPLAAGMAVLVPSAQLTDTTGNMIVTRAPVCARFAGSYPAPSLLATDNGDLEPAGWAWTVSFPQVPGDPQPFSFFLPADAFSFTATDANPAVFTAAGSSYQDGTVVALSGSSLPGGFLGGWPSAPVYYVVNASGDTFQLAATLGGTPLASTSAGSGTVQVAQVYLSSLTPVSDVVTMQAYMPLPSGTAAAEDLAVASGSGGASAWTPMSSLIAGYTALTAPQPGDLLPIVDGGTTKKITVDALLSDGLDGTPLNANPTFESGVSSWGNNNGAYSAQSSAWAWAGTYSCKVTPDGSTANPELVAELVSITADTKYSVSAVLYCPAGWGPGVFFNIDWYDGGSYLSTSVALFAVPAGEPVQLQLTATSPGSATIAQFYIRFPGILPATTVFYVDEAAIYQGSTPASLVLRSDGIKTFLSPIIPGDLPGNLVQTTAQQLNGKTGIYVPSDWGQRGWHAALAATGGGLARVSVVGDSLARGYYASSLRTKGFIGLINTALQNAYGNGGSGWHGAVDTAVAATALGVNASAITAYGTSGDYWTVAGTWTVDSNVYGDFVAGPGGIDIKTTDNTTPGSVTVHVTGSTVKIFTLSSGGGFGSWEYQVDGGTAVPVSDGSGFNIQVTTVSTGSAGAHTIKITYTDAGTKSLHLLGMLAYNASGVVVKNYSYYGSTMWLWNNSQLFNFGFGASNITAGPVGSWSGGSNDPSDLVIVHSSGNDAAMLANTNVGLASNVSADATSVVLNGYLPPGKYDLFNGSNGEMVVLGFPTIAGSQYTYALPNSLVYSYTTSNCTIYGAIESPDVWETYMRQYLSDVLDGQSQAGATDIIIVMQHIGTYETSLQGSGNQRVVQYQDFLARARGLAEAYGAALIDLWAVGHNSWNWMHNNGYMVNPASPGSAGSDGVHLSDAGHAWAAAVFQALITALT